MSNKNNDETIYSAYRLALKGQPRGASTRAAARKQKARKIIAERYKLPISRVKQIVREFDELNGITHEQNPAEVFMRACSLAMAETREALENSAEPERCPHCGESEADDLPMRDRFDEIAGRGRNVEVRLDRFAYAKGIARARILCDACQFVANSPALAETETVLNSTHRAFLEKQGK